MSFINDSDYISFRHHVYYKEDGIKILEIGPRFEMQRNFVFTKPT
jgi:U3 small nucleolar ribonucleoprotein protein IMP4